MAEISAQVASRSLSQTPSSSCTNARVMGRMRALSTSLSSSMALARVRDPASVVAILAVASRAVTRRPRVDSMSAPALASALTRPSAAEMSV